MIKPNYFTLILRTALLSAFLYLVGVIVENYHQGKYEGRHPIIYIGIIVFTLWPVYIGWSLIGVFRLTYSRETRLITFWSLGSGNREVDAENIIGYFETKFDTRLKSYRGCIIKMDNGQSFEFTEYNLQDLQDFYEFLAENSIPCIGHKTSWYPLKRKV